MGGANSKLKLNSGTVRRFEEFKKRRNATKLQAENELLKDGGNRDNNSQSSNGTKPAEEVSTKEESPVRVVTAEKPSRVVPLPTSTAKHESVEGRDVEKDSKHNHHQNQEKVEDSNKSKVEQDNKDNDHYGQEKVEEFQENVKQDEKHNHDGKEKVKASQERNLKKDDKHNDHDDGKEKVSHVIEKALEDIEIQKGQTEETKEDDEVFVDAKGSIDVNEQREEFGIFLPGSPSFRIYCIEANKAKVEQEELLLEEEEDEDDDEEDDEEEEEEEEQERGEKHSIAAMHQKAHSTDSVIRPPSESGSDKSASLTSDSLNSETPIAKPGKEPRTKRKGKKAKKFGAGNVKRLFKVKSCYYPTCSCAGIDDRRRMVAPPRPHN